MIEIKKDNLDSYSIRNLTRSELDFIAWVIELVGSESEITKKERAIQTAIDDFIDNEV